MLLILNKNLSVMYVEGIKVLTGLTESHNFWQFFITIGKIGATRYIFFLEFFSQIFFHKHFYTNIFYTNNFLPYCHKHVFTNIVSRMFFHKHFSQLFLNTPPKIFYLKFFAWISCVFFKKNPKAYTNKY